MALVTPVPRETGPGRFTADPQMVFAATIDTIRALPEWEIVSADPQRGEIRTIKRRRFRAADQHRLLIVPGADGTAVRVERIDRADAPHIARAKEIDEILEALESRVALPRMLRPR